MYIYSLRQFLINWTLRQVFNPHLMGWQIHWNGKVVRLTALVAIGDVEGKLQLPQWRTGQSPWRPFRFWDHIIFIVRLLANKSPPWQYHQQELYNQRNTITQRILIIISQALTNEKSILYMWRIKKYVFRFTCHMHALPRHGISRNAGSSVCGIHLVSTDEVLIINIVEHNLSQTHQSNTLALKSFWWNRVTGGTGSSHIW